VTLSPTMERDFSSLLEKKDKDTCTKPSTPDPQLTCSMPVL